MEYPGLSSCSDDNYPFMHSVSSVTVSPNTSEDNITEDGHKTSSHGTVDIFSTPHWLATSRYNSDESGLTDSLFSPTMASKSADSAILYSPKPRPFPAVGSGSKSPVFAKKSDKGEVSGLRKAVYGFFHAILALPETSDTWSMFAVPAIFALAIVITLIVQGLSSKPCNGGHSLPLLSESTSDANTSNIEFTVTAAAASVAALPLNDMTAASTNNGLAMAMIKTRHSFASHPVVLAFHSSKSMYQQLMISVTAFLDYWWDQFVHLVTAPPFDPIGLLVNPL